MSDLDTLAPEPGSVRVLADGRDGQLTCRLLGGAGIGCDVVPTVDRLGLDLDEAWVLIIAEERLTAPDMALLVDQLSHQPAWSDLPIIVVARPGGRAGRVMQAVEDLGNVSVLARPLTVDALITAVRSGFRARSRQFQVRDLLTQRDEADRRKDEFLAMLAHELRNPLAPIRGAVGLMRMLDLTDPNLIEASEVLERQVRHMARLVDDLMDVSRITRGTIELRLQPIDLVEVARNAARMSSAAMETRGHTFEHHFPLAPIDVEADPTRLEQVMVNLLANAAKYTDPGGTVRLTIEHHPPEAIIRVADDGVGIDPEVLPRIFDLFAQADRSLDRSQGGLGIGLTIVRQLVELHGGTVEAHSEGPGQGTEILVRLPHKTSTHDGQANGANLPQANPVGRGLRVLLVEDNRDGAELLSRVLRLQGHEVRLAHDGLTALKLAPGFRPQVVITDIGLPGIDGYELARRIRCNPKLGNPLIVAVTGYGQCKDIAQGDDAGFDHYLVKPVDVAALIALILDPDGHSSGLLPRNS